MKMITQYFKKYFANIGLYISCEWCIVPSNIAFSLLFVILIIFITFEEE